MGTTVNLIIRRKVGADEIEVRYASVVEKGGEEMETRRLSQLAAEALREYVQNIAPIMPTSRPTGAGDTATGAWYDVEEVRFSKERGKAYLKVCTGQWMQHGITVWPEVWKPAGIPDIKAAEEFDGVKQPGWKVFVGEKAGRPHVMEMIIGPKP